VPELPEVETVRRRLAPVLEGRTLERVEIEDSRLVRPLEPLEVAAELEGERVRSVGRRGKYLLVGFDSGRTLVVHLRMTGTVLHQPADEVTHRRALLTLDDGTRVAYRDVRRFGTWQLLEPGELEPYLTARLGAEPLGRFTAAALGLRLAGRRTSLKAALLDQRTLAGLGNIYVDEALWYARLHPLRTAGSLEADELRRLHRGIRRALDLGIERQGSTLSDYRLPDGSAGSMQREFRVYGRSAEPCDRCGTELAKIRVAGRGTWFCPRCQPT
jgi:formamidopyrimidine-DNA glycosylase